MTCQGNVHDSVNRGINLICIPVCCPFFFFWKVPKLISGWMLLLYVFPAWKCENGHALVFNRWRIKLSSTSTWQQAKLKNRSILLSSVHLTIEIPFCRSLKHSFHHRYQGKRFKSRILRHPSSIPGWVPSQSSCNRVKVGIVYIYSKPSQRWYRTFQMSIQLHLSLSLKPILLSTGFARLLLSLMSMIARR